MAKITILGDTIQIKSAITERIFERAENYDPGVLKLVDGDGNEYFGICRGDASYSKYGVTFCSTDSDGKLFMTTNNPVINQENPDFEREVVKKAFAQVLDKLNQVEEQVFAAEEELTQIEKNVDDSVVFA